MNYVIELLDILAWPGATIWIGYMFRSEIRTLMSRMSEFRYRDVEAKFDKALKGAESQALSLPDNTNSSSFNLRRIPYEKYIEIAEVSPRAAIFEAWIELESAVFEAAKNLNLKPQSRYDAYYLMKQLYENKSIPKETLNTFRNLRSLRNQAAHIPDFALDSNEATRYLELSLKVVNSLAMVGETGLNIKSNATPTAESNH